LIGQLATLDQFIQQMITDIWFPFTPTSLPYLLAPEDRTKFLEVQDRVLTKSFWFEKQNDGKHMHFFEGEQPPL
jgi:hypothetical protein